MLEETPEAGFSKYMKYSNSKNNNNQSFEEHNPQFLFFFTDFCLPHWANNLNLSKMNIFLSISNTNITTQSQTLSKCLCVGLSVDQQFHSKYLVIDWMDLCQIWPTGFHGFHKSLLKIIKVGWVIWKLYTRKEFSTSKKKTVESPFTCDLQLKYGKLYLR